MAGQHSVAVVVRIAIVHRSVAVGVHDAFHGVDDSIRIRVEVDEVGLAITVRVHIAFDRVRDAVIVGVEVESVRGAVAVGVGTEALFIQREDSVPVVVFVLVVRKSVRVRVHAVSARRRGRQRALDAVHDPVSIRVHGRERGVHVVEYAVVVFVAVAAALGAIARAVAVGVLVVPVGEAVGVDVARVGRALVSLGVIALEERVHPVPVVVDVAEVRHSVHVEVGEGGRHPEDSVAIGDLGAVGVEGIVQAVAVGIHSALLGVGDPVRVRVVSLRGVLDAIGVGVEREVVGAPVAIRVETGRARGTLGVIGDAVAIAVHVAPVGSAAAIEVGKGRACADHASTVLREAAVDVEGVIEAILVAVHAGRAHVGRSVGVGVRALRRIRDAIAVRVHVAVVGVAVAVGVRSGQGAFSDERVVDAVAVLVRTRVGPSVAVQVGAACFERVGDAIVIGVTVEEVGAAA